MSSGASLVYSLTYASSASCEFSPDDLRKLLARSRMKNERAGLTGMLLYKGGNFMQVLEGEAAAVHHAMAKIAADARHKDILVLLHGEVPAKTFGNWSMAYRDLNTVAGHAAPGYDDFLNTPLNDARFMREPSACRKLLQIFKANM